VFSETQKLDLGLREHAIKVEEEWHALNGTDASLGRRTNVERAFTLFRTEWSAGYNRSHFSEFEMQINSWGYTRTNNSVKDPPPLRHEDLKVGGMTPLSLAAAKRIDDDDDGGGGDGELYEFTLPGRFFTRL
jgi:hypothetical protein